jgi:GGDEF domain-containing protein
VSVLADEAALALEREALLTRRIAAALPHGQTCSVGVAVWDGVETAATLVDRADRALYRAKALGRDRIELDGRESGPSPGPGRGLAAPAHA